MVSLGPEENFETPAAAEPLSTQSPTSQNMSPGPGAWASRYFKSGLGAGLFILIDRDSVDLESPSLTPRQPRGG